MTKPSGNTLYRGKYLDLMERAGWEFAHRHHASAVVVLFPLLGEETLLIEQHRVPIDKTCIEFPAGLVGDEAEYADEEILEAANRELEEETGYRAGKLEILDHSPSTPGFCTEIMTFILASVLEKVSAGGGVDGENITVHKVALAEMDDWLASQRKLGKLIDSKVYAGLYFLLQHLSGANR